MKRVLIADDHAIVRKGLRQILAGEPDLVVDGEAGDGEAALELVSRGGWDIVLLDMSMPGKPGLAVLQEIKKISPDLPVLVLSIYPERLYALRVLQSGAAAYLTKESAPEQLVNVIRKVLAGGRYVSPGLAEKLVLEMTDEYEKQPHERLSDREYQVFQMLAAGRTVSEVAVDLDLSVKTVSAHRRRILDKMEMKNNAELMYYAINQGLVTREALTPSTATSG